MTAVQTAAKQANVVSMSWGSEFQGESQYDSVAYFGNLSLSWFTGTMARGSAGVAGGLAQRSQRGARLDPTSSWSIAARRFECIRFLLSGFSGSTGGRASMSRSPATSWHLGNITRATRRGSDADHGLRSITRSSEPTNRLFKVGGTSAGALWGGISDADQARGRRWRATSSTQTLNLLYGLYSTSSYRSDFYDVTSGFNFAGDAGWGYDLVTGIGTPYASKIVSAAATYTVTSTKLKASTVAAATTSATKATAQTVASSPSSPSVTATTPASALTIPVTSVVAMPVSLFSPSSSVAVQAVPTVVSGFTWCPAAASAGSELRPVLPSAGDAAVTVRERTELQVELRCRRRFRRLSHASARRRCGISPWRIMSKDGLRLICSRIPALR